MNSTGENLPRELFDEIRTGNVEKSFWDTNDRQKQSKIYKIKYKLNVNRSVRKKADWYASVTITLDTNRQKVFSGKHGN